MRRRARERDRARRRARRRRGAVTTRPRFEVTYATSRVARVAAADRETAKRAFAAYVLYDDDASIVSDVQLAFGIEAELAPADDPPERPELRDDVRAWLARREAESESFEPGLYEDRERSLDPYLRALATNDPWRLEGHGSRGRVLSAVPVAAELVTFDGRVRYAFDATRYVDYLRLETLVVLDPSRPQDALRVEALVDVSALADDGLRQIVSSYETIANEWRLTERFARTSTPRRSMPYDVTFAPTDWLAYLAHRHAAPERFAPPPGWRSAFERYD